MRAGSATADPPRPIREICDEHEGEWLLIKILDASAPMGDAPGLLLARTALTAARCSKPRERSESKIQPRSSPSLEGEQSSATAQLCAEHWLASPPKKTG